MRHHAIVKDATHRQRPRACAFVGAAAALVLATLVLPWAPPRALAQPARPQAAAPAPRVLQVGPGRALATLAEAVRAAGNGDTIEIDAGDYVGESAVLLQDDLTLRAVGAGRARFHAGDALAEDKAILVIRGDRVRIEGLELTDARVPDRNGAGIRHERGRLTVRDCLFARNEMGLLTSNDEHAELVVEQSEFRGNRVADTYRPGERIGHQIYVGTIGRFTLRESYVHDGAYGHLVKSRARESVIVDNRITDDGGRASYELEFPNGGIALVLGNLIGQGPGTQNDEIVSYGAEGYRWSDNELYLAHNTFVDGLARRGRVLHVYDGAARVDVTNNLVLGNALTRPAGGGRFMGNVTARPRDVVDARLGDYRLRRGSPLVGRAHDAGSARGVVLRPARDYIHPMRSREVAPARYSPGAFQETVP